MPELILHFRQQPQSRQLLKTVCTVLVFAWLIAAAEVHAHELEDGFVERAVAVVVRPGEATVSYSIGANENTRQQLIDRWSADEETENSAAAEPPAAEEQGQEEDNADFLAIVGDAVVKGTAVEVDGNPVALELVEVIPTPRHHVEATVVMRLKLPSPVEGAGSVVLTLYDRNFETLQSVSEPGTETTASDAEDVPAALSGAFRYAIKGAKGVMLNRSTAAPILVRAKRRLVAEIPEDQLEAEQQLSAEVILP